MEVRLEEKETTFYQLFKSESTRRDGTILILDPKAKVFCSFCNETAPKRLKEQRKGEPFTRTELTKEIPTHLLTQIYKLNEVKIKNPD